MNLAQALKRIEELEQRLAKLEAEPKQQIHYHTHQAPTIPHYDLVPQPIYPQWPQPFQPWISPPVWCGAGMEINS